MYSNRILMVAALAALLTACGGQDPVDGSEAPVEPAALEPAPAHAMPGPDQATPASDPGVQPVTLAHDGVAIGSALGANGAVATAKPVYAVDGTIHASVPVASHPPGTEVSIYWFGANGSSIKTETKPVAAENPFVNFSLAPSDGIAPGRYTAQVDIGGAPVGMADFVVE